MSLEPGKQLGIYKIVALLGEGGMGQVYRAHDSKLDREVAIKVLPDATANDPESLARFEREAKLLAALTHPNIAAIYGFEEADGKHFLVLELVEGLTLSERIASEPLNVEESVHIAGQIAEALDAAHEKGIIHRDLKPANVKITPDDQVKVLDFGLAKAMTDEESAGDPSTSPTLTENYTRPGVILGTAAYMSPEQARGRPVDRRSDVWSFGCVLYECLTGRSTFQGDTISDLLGAVLKEEPDWDALPADTPHWLKQLLQRLLIKDRRLRLRDMGDVSILLTDDTSPNRLVQPTSIDATDVGSAWKTSGGWMIAACLALAAGWFYISRSPAEMESQPRTTIQTQVAFDDDKPYTTPANNVHRSIAISPDGQWIAYCGGGEPERLLYYRRIDELQWQIVPNSEGAHSPFFSPSGQKLAFFTIGQLKMVALGTKERPENLKSTLRIAGTGCWEDEQTILYLETPTKALSRVDVNTRQHSVAFDDEEFILFGPELLPGDGRALVSFLNRAAPLAGFQIGIVDLETKRLKPLGVKGSVSGYDEASRRLVYAKDGNILTVPFDLEKTEVTGSPELLVTGVSQSGAKVMQTGVAELRLSRNGRLIYVLDTDQDQRRLVSIDPAGPPEQTRELMVGNLPGLVRVRPGGQQLAVRIDIANATGGIRLLHLDPPRMGQLVTDSHTSAHFPTWDPDGNSLSYMYRLGVYTIEIGGSAIDKPTFVGTGRGAYFPLCWHPEGNVMLYLDEDPDSHWDIRLFDKQTGDTSDYVKTPFAETAASFSPDGKWVAYQSNEGGRFEIFVRPYPLEPGFPKRVSMAGGTEPMWSHSTDPMRLYYRIGQKMMSVDFFPEQSPEFSEAKELFQGRYAMGQVRPAYDVDAEDRFYMIELAESESPKHLNMVLDWNAKFLNQ